MGACQWQTRPGWTCSKFFCRRRTRRNINGYEPQVIDLIELAESVDPKCSWADLTLNQQVDLLRTALQPDTVLISPHSTAMKYWDILILISLIFTGLVTPYEVTFIKVVAISLFAVNRVFDLIFMADMVLQFFLQIEIKKQGGYGTTMIRDPKAIRWRYLKTWFAVDLISILPFDIIMLAQRSDSQSVSSLQQAKILRCLRLMKLVKLIRILRTSRLMQRWQNKLAVSFAVQKALKFSTLLLSCSHWMACVWGFTGLTFGEELCTAEGYEIVFGPNNPVPIAETSWLTTLYVDGKVSPDSPCTHWHTYLASLHFAVMTITSIGYGDIVPTRESEYIVCIFCMLSGGVLWAYVIGCTCSILSHKHPVEEQFETATDMLNTVMKEVDVPKEKQQRFREFLREAKVRDSFLVFQKVAESFSAQPRGELMLHLSKESVKNVRCFRDAPGSFITDVADSFTAHFFARREPLRGIERHLCIVRRGTVAHGGRVITPGSAFQEDMIISSSAFQHIKPAISLNYSLVLLLSRESLEACLERCPEFAPRLRFRAACLALRRVLVLCARSMKHSGNGKAKSGLCEAFDAAYGMHFGIQLDQSTRHPAEAALMALQTQSKPPDHALPKPAVRNPCDLSQLQMVTGELSGVVHGARNNLDKLRFRTRLETIAKDLLLLCQDMASEEGNINSISNTASEESPISI